MNQFDIFSNPASRSTDPHTSHKAEEEFTILGKRAERCRQVLQLVAQYPGSTTGELARYMHRDYPHIPIASAVALAQKEPR